MAIFNYDVYLDNVNIYKIDFLWLKDSFYLIIVTI